MEFGILSGTRVSHIRGNLVDLETELRGQNRNASLCPAKHYMPHKQTEDNSYVQPESIKIRGTPNRQERNIDTTLTHLSSCQMIRYKPVPEEPQPVWDTCKPNGQ
tara:strand:+ start:202 stop:516 length:315 start_codon:yes stop_codon:yes gene_type:complete